MVSYDTHPSRKKPEEGDNIRYFLLIFLFGLVVYQRTLLIFVRIHYHLLFFVSCLLLLFFFGVFFFFDVYLVDFNERVNLGQHTADTFNCPVLLIQLKCRIRLADLLTLLTATNQ